MVRSQLTQINIIYAYTFLSNPSTLIKRDAILREGKLNRLNNQFHQVSCLLLDYSVKLVLSFNLTFATNFMFHSFLSVTVHSSYKHFVVPMKITNLYYMFV